MTYKRRDVLDPIVSLMKKLGVPMTREKYLELAYLTTNPDLGPEEEAELPPEFQRPDWTFTAKRRNGPFNRLTVRIKVVLGELL